MSSGGAKLQIIAHGTQDIYLTGNPQKTFFKVMYERHTPFALESKALMFDGTPNFGQRITCLIPKSGDLLSKLYLEVMLPKLVGPAGEEVAYTHNVGHALIKEISIQIGEQEIDRQTGEWMEIASRLGTSQDRRAALDALVGAGGGLYETPSFVAGPQGTKVTVPLQFWFCQNYGSVLPLCALQYHPIRLNIKLRPVEELVGPADLIGISTVCGVKTTGVSTNGMMPAFLLWADYVHLGVEEVRRFAGNSHEYLITQVQYTQPTAVAAGADRVTAQIDFNHPVKELCWVVHRNLMKSRNEWFNWSSASLYDIVESGATPRDNLVDATLLIDGKERFENRDATYFRLIQPYQHHTRVDLDYFIYCYSFALRPEEFQPSGSLNMSLMNSVTLNVGVAGGSVNGCDAGAGSGSGSGSSSAGSATAGATMTVYGTNMNVLRITNGLGGLMFKV
jgi:hypothetical protein